MSAASARTASRGRRGPGAATPALDLVRTLLVGVTLNLCWALGCVLVVTAPSSCAALHAAVGRWRSTGEEPTPSSFLADLRRTGAPGAGLALLLATTAAVLALDLVAIGGMGGQRRVVLVGWLAVALGVAIVAVWLPAVLASMPRPTLRGALRGAARSTVRHPLRSSAALAVVVLVLGLLWVSPLAALVLPAPAALAFARLLGPVTSLPHPPEGDR